jgi:hypothetical protein
MVAPCFDSAIAWRRPLRALPGDSVLARGQQVDAVAKLGGLAGGIGQQKLGGLQALEDFIELAALANPGAGPGRQPAHQPGEGQEAGERRQAGRDRRGRGRGQVDAVHEAGRAGQDRVQCGQPQVIERGHGHFP